MNILEKIQEVNNQKTTFITPENLAPNVSVFGVTSNMNNLGDLNIILGEAPQHFEKGYVNSIDISGIDSNVVKNMEPNLTSANIANGVSIFDIQGSFVGEATNLEEYFNYPNNEQTEQTPFRMSSDLYNSLPYNITENIVSLSGSFGDSGQSSVKLLDMDTTNVVNIANMFSGNNFTKLTGSGHFIFTNKVKNRANTAYVFTNCNNVTDITPLENWNVSTMENFDKFFNAYNLGNLSPLNNWDVSDMTNMAWFYNGATLRNLDFMSNWNTGHLQNMACAFGTKISVPSNISGLRDLDVGNVTNMYNLFDGRINIDDFSPLANWNVSSVTDVTNMFNNVNADANLAVALDNWVMNSMCEFPCFGKGAAINTVTNLTLPNVTDIYGNTYAGTVYNNHVHVQFDGNSDMNQSLWHVPNLTNMQDILFNLVGFNGLNNNSSNGLQITNFGKMVENWLDQGNVKTIRGIIGLSTSWGWGYNLCNLNFASNWNLTGVETFQLINDPMNYHLYLNIRDISAVSNWDMSTIHNISYLFANCSNLTDVSALTTWNITNNMENMAYTFCNVPYTAWDKNGNSNAQFLKTWDVSNVTNFAYMFSMGSGWNNGNVDVSFINDWNFASAKDISGLFRYASDNALKLLNGKDFNNVENLVFTFMQTNINPNYKLHFENAKSLAYTFNNCQSFVGSENITFGNNVQNMYGIYSQCSNLRNLTSLRNMHTDNLQNLGSAFSACYNLTDITGLQNMNTTNVTDYSRMFVSDNNLTNINALSNWDVSNGTAFNYMFAWCNNMTDMSSLTKWNFNTAANNINMYYMFFNMRKVSNWKSVANWNTQGVSHTGEMFAYCNGITLNIANWDMSSVTNIDSMFRGITGWTSLNNIPNFSNALCGIYDNGDVHYAQLDGLQNLFIEWYNLNDASAITNWFTGNHAFMPISNNDHQALAFDFSSTNVVNYEFLSNWNICVPYGYAPQTFCIQASYVSDIPRPFALCVNNNGGNLTDNSLNAIVNALLNINIKYQNAGYVQSGWDQQNVPFTLGTSVVSTQYGDMSYNVGIGLTDSQITRINTINPNGLKALQNNGWAITSGYYTAYEEYY
jgi:surface protein